MLRPLAAIAGALLASTAAGAQDRPQPTIASAAADLAYGYCPLFLAEQFPLNAPQLARYGFGTAVEKRPDARFGELSMVAAARDDGQLAFGGVSGKVCTVVISGPQGDSALELLRERMPSTGLTFKSVPYDGPSLPRTMIEVFQAPIEGQFIYVQLIQNFGPAPAAIAQLFVTDE